MIYTLTCDPSLDLIVLLSRLHPGETHRANSVTIRPGGNGIHISLTLTQLGISSSMLGFTSGCTGRELVHLIRDMGGTPSFIDLHDGNTPIRLLLCAPHQTKIHAPSLKLSARALSELETRLKLLHPGDYLVLSGDVPPTPEPNLYGAILCNMKSRGVECVVDAPAMHLRHILAYAPFLIKSNFHELGELFQVQLSETDDIIFYARRLQACGARNILVSMGAKGAILLTEHGEILRAPVPQGKPFSSTGAGASMIAGFLSGWLEAASYRTALERAVCAGAATAYEEWLAGRDAIYALLRQYRAEGAVL